MRLLQQKTRGWLVLLLVSTLYSSYACDAKRLPVPTADEVLTTALAQAKKENKSVMIIFHASWCGWCRKMHDFLLTPEVKPLFEKNYVIAYLTVQESPNNKSLENPGAEALLDKYKSSKMGIPVWFIFDKKGTLQVDSHLRQPGQGLEVRSNTLIGFPGTEQEIRAFTDALKKTSELNNAELVKIAGLLKNKG